MAHRLFDPHVTINSVDLSDHAISLTPNRKLRVVPDDTADTFQPYLSDAMDDMTPEIEFAQDVATGEVEATLRTAHGTAVVCVIRPSAAAIGTTNPAYTATCYVENLNPFGGARGSQEKVTVKLWPTTAWVVTTA